jgi:hypothetical protein
MDSGSVDCCGLIIATSCCFSFSWSKLSMIID